MFCLVLVLIWNEGTQGLCHITGFRTWCLTYSGQYKLLARLLSPPLDGGHRDKVLFFCHTLPTLPSARPGGLCLQLDRAESQRMPVGGFGGMLVATYKGKT